MLTATGTDVSRAQATFLATVVSKFTPEAFHTLRRYLETTGDIRSLTALLLKAQRFSDTGMAIAAKAVKAEDFRERQGMLSVSNVEWPKLHLSNSSQYIKLFILFFPYRKHRVVLASVKIPLSIKQLLMTISSC